MAQRTKLAILGAGPTGLDAALAAKEMGLDFTLYEAGDGVASYIRQWGHVRLFSPWDLNVSPRIQRELEMLGRPAPTGAECTTGNDMVERAFQPFFRGGERHRGGHGVGLTIVKRFADRFGWPLAIDSTPGVGTRVVVGVGT